MASGKYGVRLLLNDPYRVIATNLFHRCGDTWVVENMSNIFLFVRPAASNLDEACLYTIERLSFHFMVRKTVK
jgi:hypothetical protein